MAHGCPSWNITCTQTHKHDYVMMLSWYCTCCCTVLSHSYSNHVVPWMPLTHHLPGDSQLNSWGFSVLDELWELGHSHLNGVSDGNNPYFVWTHVLSIWAQKPYSMGKNTWWKHHCASEMSISEDVLRQVQSHQTVWIVGRRWLPDTEMLSFNGIQGLK